MEIGDKGLIIRRGLKPLTIPLGAPQVGDTVICIPIGNRGDYVAVPLGNPQVGDTVALLPEGGTKRYVAVPLEAGAVYEKDYYLTIWTGSWVGPFINCGWLSYPDWGTSMGAPVGMDITRVIKSPPKNTEINVKFDTLPSWPSKWFNICGKSSDLPGNVYNAYLSTEIKGFIDVQFVDYPYQYADPFVGTGSVPDTIGYPDFRIANDNWPSENGTGRIEFSSWTPHIHGPFVPGPKSVPSSWSKTIWTRNYHSSSYDHYWVITDCDVSFRRWRLYGDSAP